MAPCSTNYSSIHHIRISERDNIKLRKPIVEKMRRDRINSCIEQLKIILEKEFHKQEPNSKLEKADILEMTVSFLRQQLQPGLCRSDYSQGYSHCWRDSLHFLSAGSSKEASFTSPQGLQQKERHEQPLHQAQRGSSFSPVCSTLRPTTLQDSSSSSSRGPVWRPW
ncbi:transcription factor HES-5-like [Xiphias gladius]|uniref:transcription factor HES-5-like n=1 Tax=Xiphias gladius TaxID=8245 RepID=UPI001A98D393|nr:transcription factor HES-5-like [Xiphias gladius]XP_040009116.1 transcription factor HES-5-like [Xiphias gladius]